MDTSKWLKDELKDELHRDEIWDLFQYKESPNEKFVKPETSHYVWDVAWQLPICNFHCFELPWSERKNDIYRPEDSDMI